MKKGQVELKSQDVVLLLALVSDPKRRFRILEIHRKVGISPAEISTSFRRSEYAGLYHRANDAGFTFAGVQANSLYDFLIHGVPYVWPVQPGPVTRGVSTAHSVSPFREELTATEGYVWPWGQGSTRGISLSPLYPTLPERIIEGDAFHQLLAAVDILRVGRLREKQLAQTYLHEQLLDMHA